MVSGVSKRIVVIKDIPSNMIEEAILILKKEPGGKNSDLLLKEAELIISTYIRENKLGDFNRKERGADPRLSGAKISTNFAINLGLLGSIALLVFILLKFI